jgi:hypothetical protein
VLSRPPGRLVADLRMGLRAPRDQIATMVAQAFVCLRAEMAGCAARQRRPIEAPARRGGPGMARFLQ